MPHGTELNNRLAWKQETTGTLVKQNTNNRTPTKYLIDRSTKNTDTTTNPAPLTAEETNAKTEVGYGDVSKSVEPANSAPRDSSTLRTIPRTRELP